METKKEKIYQLLKDKKVIKEAKTENELLEYMQKHTSYSWDWGFKYEGWEIAEKITVMKNGRILN